MNINIPELIIGIFKTLLIGLVLFIIAIYSIPSDWVIKILKILKPNILKDLFLKNDKYFNSILSILLNGSYTANFVNENKAEKLVEKLKGTRKELENIEKNMFTIDLLSDLFKTLSFAAGNYTMSSSEELIDSISNYFRNYSTRLIETSYRRNFADDILQKFEEMSQSFSETKEFEDKDIKKDRMWKESRKNHALQFERYLQNEKIELSKTRELVIDSIKLNAIELMNLAK